MDWRKIYILQELQELKLTQIQINLLSESVAWDVQKHVFKFVACPRLGAIENFKITWNLKNFLHLRLCHFCIQILKIKNSFVI